MEKINSNSYWDARFLENWESNSGPSQSRFFARLAIEHLPKWLISVLKRDSLTLADWGCAQGDGTNEWGAYLDARQLTGIDFSAIAIEQATQRYPAVRFIVEDWLSNNNVAQDRYDLVFSSNVMEHFHRPYDVLHTLSERARKGVILALPYREMNRHEEHFFTFLSENVPLALPNNFRLVWSQVLDCREITNTHWSGDQIILIYANTKWTDSLGLSLHDCLVAHEDIVAEKIQLHSTLANRDRQIATLNVAHAEREREMQDNLLAVQNELRQVEQVWMERSWQHEARYTAERTGLQVKLEELQLSLLATEREKNEQLHTRAERERELQENLLIVRNELRQAEQVWMERCWQHEARYTAERTGLQVKLEELQQSLLATEREKNEQLQTRVEREHELQENLLAVRNEFIHSEQSWIARADQQEAHYAAEQAGLQVKLDQLQQSLLAAEREKNKQLQTHAVREHELQDNLLAVRNELRQVEQVWVERSGQHEARYAAERIGLQAKLNDLQHSLLTTEREKAEQLQTHAEREREMQNGLLTVRNELLNSERAWIEKADEQEARCAAAFQVLAECERTFNVQLQRLDNAAHEWQSAATAKQADIDAILNSKFWYITAPLRKLIWRNSKILNDLSQKTEILKNSVISIEKISNSAREIDGNRFTETTYNEKSQIMDMQFTHNVKIEINNIHDLLELYGESFVREAYRILLGRHPDAEGFAYYINRLRKGVNKLDILIQLKASKEAANLNVNFPGMDETIRRYKLSQLPFCGWIKPPNERMDNRLRMIENRLFEVNDASSKIRIAQLEVEVAEKNYCIEEKDAYIAQLLQAISKPADLTWEQFESQILSHRASYKGIFIQELVIDWNVPLYQRPQHIATAFGRLGYLVIYKTANWGSGDNINGFRQVAPNVWMTSVWEANNITDAVHSIYSTAYFHQPDDIAGKIKDGVIIYEYIDHIDPQISGEGETIERLLKLQDWAFGGGADFVVASARKLEAEAVSAVGRENVFLAQNGVDNRHYRNPIHLSTPLPENLLSFKRKYSNIVGYFGALAPWLWYEVISELVEARPDLGFVFIGPDYYGGVEKLPVSDNVLYLGVVDYKILPAYARQFDVCFIPFAPGEIAKTTSPLKLFEYFSLEKPVVVTSEMAECVAFPEVFSGDTVSSLSKAIDRAIEIKSDATFKARLAELADQNDWDARAKVMEACFAKLSASRNMNN